MESDRVSLDETVELLHKENGGNMSESWRVRSWLCSIAESLVKCYLNYSADGEMKLK